MCGTPPSFKIAEPMSICCSHNPSSLESSKKKDEVHVDVCDVVVLVVVVVIMVMVSAVLVMCVLWLLSIH